MEKTLLYNLYIVHILWKFCKWKRNDFTLQIELIPIPSDLKLIKWNGQETPGNHLVLYLILTKAFGERTHRLATVSVFLGHIAFDIFPTEFILAYINKMKRNDKIIN